MEILLRSASEVPEAFVERLRTRTPGEQALATTMSIDFKDNPIVDGLVACGLPGDVLAVDYFGHVSGPSALWLGQRGHKEARAVFERDFPGSYTVLGEPETDNTLDKYYQGRAVNRSHIKALAVGSRILSLGGVNFTNYSYENSVDAMLEFESQEFADFLAWFIEKDGNLRDRDGPGVSFALTDQNEVLVDNGKSDQSLIMNRVFADFRDEEILSVAMSSTYMPAGYMYGRLHNVAEAGGEVVVYTNSLVKFRKPHTGMLERKHRREDLAFIALGNLAARRRLVPIVDCLPKGTFNHFKALVIRNKTGGGVAYMGSHNFHPISVKFGTAEIALRTTDPVLMDQIETFMADNLAPSEDRRQARLFGLRDVFGALSPM